MLYIFIALICLLILFLFASYCTYVFTFRARKDRARDAYFLPTHEAFKHDNEIMFSLISDFDALPYERVYTKSFDGLTLTARYYHIKDGAPIQLQCHGYRGNPIRDFCGGSKLARELNHNFLVIEQRAHQDSQGNVISFGVNERKDVCAWHDYLVDRFGKDVDVLLYGVSMGAATVLMAGAYNLSNVRCIVADCPYSTPQAIIKKVSRGMGFPAFLSMPLAYTGAFLFGRFRLSGASAVEGAKNTRVPILLIHGENDLFVPCSMSREIAMDNKHVRLETFPDADHALSFIKDFDRYRRVCFEFLSENL